MTYTAEGTIKQISEAQTFGSGFTKREFVLTIEDGKYSQDISFECLQDKCSLLDGLSEGDPAVVSFNIRGREYNGRYFNNLVCWKIDSEAGNHQAPAASRESDRPKVGREEDQSGDFSDDIPF